MSDTLQSRAMNFALKAHGDQMYGDHPYSYHLGQVVANVMIRKKDDPLLSTYVAVAWLHDTMEDCGVTFKQIQDEFGLAIADSVQRLTKTKEMQYEHYLAGCIMSAVAREVKICDTMANLMESFRNNREKGMLKYPKQLAILTAGVWAGELLFNKGEE
ncbi:putative phosphohydrolase [Pseudomonas phage COT4]|uniref:Hydrolase n=1 Tax=Pseudomonas phage M5.1 TaxID=2873460 RepID=A0AAE9BNX3_9CAUD|nr:hydrolase [Pseudomonas phage M5.1]UAV89635.1 hydrolase [Pseudomonas phage M5.1]UGL61234.1 putative phosphohydrolase [Pseudomonas phage COT4]